MNCKVVKNDLYDYKDRYIYQLEAGFKFSLDSLLISEYVDAKKSKYILDLCTGNAAIPLVLSKYTKANIIGFEIQKEIYLLAEKSVEINDLQGQIKIINDDVKNIENYYEKEFFDIIVCNPPFYKVNTIKDLNKNDFLSKARHEISLKLEDVISIVKNNLRDNGTFYLVYIAERLDEVILLSDKYKLKVKEIQFVITKEDAQPKIVLFKIKKQGKNGVRIPKIIDISKYSTYQNMFRRI